MKHLFRKTKRLHIRPYTPRDYGVWRNAHLQMSPSKNKWDQGPRSESELSKSEFKKVLAGQKLRMAQDSFYDLGIFNSKAELVGGVALMEVTRGISHTAYLGYKIFNGHWEKGYGKEAVKAMIDIGFKDLHLHRIEAGIEPGNARSIRLAKALKMRREGLKKRAIFLRDQWVDLIMYTLTTEDLGLPFKTSNLKLKRRS